MAIKQTRLELKAIEERKEQLVKNDYSPEEGNRYSESSKDAISNGTPLGKGNNSGIPAVIQPGTRPIGELVRTINTQSSDYNGGDKTIGGLYDIEGYNGTGGRRRAASINLYNGANQYPMSMDTSKNIGQYHSEIKRGHLHVQG